MVRHHPVVHRTSARGSVFIGMCAACGRVGLTWQQARDEECRNPDGITRERALLEAIDPGHGMLAP